MRAILVSSVTLPSRSERLTAKRPGGLVARSHTKLSGPSVPGGCFVAVIRGRRGSTPGTSVPSPGAAVPTPRSSVWRRGSRQLQRARMSSGSTLASMNVRGQQPVLLHRHHLMTCPLGAKARWLTAMTLRTTSSGSRRDAEQKCRLENCHPRAIERVRVAMHANARPVTTTLELAVTVVERESGPAASTAWNVPAPACLTERPTMQTDSIES